MNEQDKHLLLKVKARVDGHINPLRIYSVEQIKKSQWAWKKGTWVVTFWNDTKSVEHVKPYLRPMSSMTEEEKKELWVALDKDMSILDSIFDAPIINEYKGRVYRGNPVHYELDFLISHHFDYCGLIEKGLALEAPIDMYNTKQ